MVRQTVRLSSAWRAAQEAERRGEGREASGSAACGASLSTAMLDAEFTGHCSAQE